MKASELIKQLQSLVDYYGDLTVEIRSLDDGDSDFNFNVYADPASDFEPKENGTITIGIAYDGSKRDSKWQEVTSTYFDEEEQCYTIDAWRTSSWNEEGRVIARVYLNPAQGTVYYDEVAKTDTYAQEVIQEVISRLE